MSARDIAIYVHIPFCEAKCHYCDFVAYAGMGGLIDAYVAALCDEAAMVKGALPPAGVAKEDNLGGARARTVYFGGGTPSLLTVTHFERLLALFPARSVGAEVTIEANPATLIGETLSGLRAIGVNRLSLGVQSFEDGILQALGRRHTAREAVASFESARRAGFDNISMDLMYGLPGQDSRRWRDTLDRAVALEPEHLSLYPLTIEERTVFGREQRRGALQVPDEDAQAEMYLAAVERLDRAGYEHYEISNWARMRGVHPVKPSGRSGVGTPLWQDGQGFRARHNLVYWHNEPYLGLGAGAHSYFGSRRFANTRRIRRYLAAIAEGRSGIDFEEGIDRATGMAETMMLGLRLSEGVTYSSFASRFGCRLLDVYQNTVAELVALDLLAQEGDRILLTLRGRLLGNEVFGRFLTASRQAQPAES